MQNIGTDDNGKPVTLGDLINPTPCGQREFTGYVRVGWIVEAPSVDAIMMSRNKNRAVARYRELKHLKDATISEVFKQST